MMDYLAHSAKGSVPEQSYKEHVENVRRMAVNNARTASEYYSGGHDLLADMADLCACYHDLGKLEKDNQKVLHGIISRAVLPINHVDAGVSALKQISPQNYIPASIVYSHHKGLPNFCDESARRKNCFRDEQLEVRSHTNKGLSDLLNIHDSLISNKPHNSFTDFYGDPSIFTRMLLSCLVDADHTDTAQHYGNYPGDSKEPLLQPEKRLKQLDSYVESFARNNNERNRLRAEMYSACRNTNISEKITACDSPVGSGKTTSIMAHLLHQAVERGSRRIFVVLPFTNIITQSVEIYRKALVLPGENPEEVVAELHYRADFDKEETRVLTAQWKAPIIVTTAVAFFETLASNQPSTLRRLHELPGSVIFVDEAHASMPVKLLPLAWNWMQSFADEWGCYWVLASGSLVRFWEINEISKKQRHIPQIVSPDLRDKLSSYEKNRVDYSYLPKPISCEELNTMVINSPGPRLLIMNTVQSAAVMAKRIISNYENNQGNQGEKSKVFHLSTSLNADDRVHVIELIKKKLSDKEDNDWVLVATSCVEAGVDFSFRTGFREISSLLSLLQASGRINRNGEYQKSHIWSFSMQDDFLLRNNPSLMDSTYILSRYFEKGISISPDLCTQAIQDELKLNNISDFIKDLDRAERTQNFVEVADKFRIIDSDTVPVVADKYLKEKIKSGDCDWKDIQKKAIMIRKYWVKELNLPEIRSGIYDWDLQYSEFLGIMDGLLDYIEKKKDSLGIKDLLIYD